MHLRLRAGGAATSRKVARAGADEDARGRRCTRMSATSRVAAAAAVAVRWVVDLQSTLAATAHGGADAAPAAGPGEALARGAVVGRYVILDQLGVGGMGIVYAAFDPDLDRKVALKLLLPASKGPSAGAREARLLREAQALARLSHPNVVAVFDVGTHEHRVWVAMEFVSGRTLGEWAKERPRSFAEKLAVLVDVGRGVAAAHAAGLVHRDLKPENVMIGGDGRVRVMDFGLAHGRGVGGEARTDEEAEVTPTGEPAPPAELAFDRTVSGGAAGVSRSGLSRPVGERPALEVRMTAMGSIQGTPAYMAPEQWNGVEADAAADQFGWSVIAWELCFGARPFVGETVTALATAVLEGRRQAPPAGRRVPRWFRRLIERGLSVEPARRWPAMIEVLAAIERGQRRTRLRALLGLFLALAVPTVVIVGWIFAQQAATVEEVEVDRCASIGALDGTWDPVLRTSVRAAIQATDLAFAAETADRVEARLDAYAAQWTAMRVEVCASRRSGAQSDLLHDRRVACLERRRAEFSALIDVYLAADRDVVTRAVRAASELAPLARCADAEALLAAIAPPPAESAAEVEQLRDALASARAEGSAGRLLPAKEKLGALIPRIDAAGYRPLRAEARMVLGVFEDSLGDFKAAAATLEAAVWSAEASGHDELVVEAAIRLLMVVGYRLAQVDAAAVWERLAEAVIERRGGAGDNESRWLSSRAIVRLRGGDAAAAEALAREALAVVERDGRGSTAEAATLHVNIGAFLGTRGDHAGAAEQSAVALAIFEETLGPNHPEIAVICTNLGTSYLHLGRLEEGERFLLRARAVVERSIGDDHPDLARIDNNLGTIYARAGRFDEALAASLRALERRTRLLGAEHSDTANSEANVADALIELGRPQEALEHVARALAGHKASIGENNARYATALALRGLAELALGRGPAALRSLEQGLAILEASAAAPELLAFTRFGVARALWSRPRGRDRALALARQALADYAQSGPSCARYVRDIEAWIDSHEGSGAPRAP